MSTENLKVDHHLSECVASLYLASKWLVWLILIATTATAGALPLGLTCIALACVAWVLEARQSIRDPGNWVLLSCGTALLVLEFVLAPISHTASDHLAALPLIALFGFYSLYSVFRQPFAFLYAKVQHVPRLRHQHSHWWLVLLSVAALFSLILSPTVQPWAIAGVALSGFIGHAWLQQVGVGSAWTPATERKVGEFEFRRVPNTPEDLKPLYELYVSELMPSLQEGSKFVPTPVEKLVEEKMRADMPFWPQIAYFAAYHNGQLIGTKSCQFDAPGCKLPFEHGHTQPLSLNRLREIGNIVELGKFCVAEKYRMSPEVFAGLLICTTELAMSRDVTFIVLQSVLRSARIYSKMGFATMTKEPVANLEHGVKVQLLAKNITAEGQSDNPLMANVQEHFSQYILCRFVWRQIARMAISRITHRPVPVSVPTRDLPGLAVFA